MLVVVFVLFKGKGGKENETSIFRHIDRDKSRMNRWGCPNYTYTNGRAQGKWINYKN